MNNYNPTCMVTGKKDNLRMHALRNEQGEMTGWIFVHESLEVKETSLIQNPITIETREKQ